MPQDEKDDCFISPSNMGLFNAVPEYVVERKNYDYLLIAYTTGGCGYLKYNNCFHTLKKGDIFVIDCNDRHEYGSLDENWNFYWIHASTNSLIDYYKKIIQAQGNVFKHSDVFINLWEKIYNNIFEQDINTAAKINLCMHELMTSLIIVNTKYDFEKVKALISLKYNEKLTLEEMAKSESMSKYFFIREFKSALGITPYEYLLNYRIGAAKQLLTSTLMTVDEIALGCGFNSTSNFIKRFKRSLGMTPLLYRKKYSNIV
jgi:AraC-like DNA-binding protein